jgi:hypothetical protein
MRTLVRFVALLGVRECDAARSSVVCKSHIDSASPTPSVTSVGDAEGMCR